MDLRERSEKFAPKDFAEIIGLFAKRPQLQFRTGPSRLQLQIHTFRINARHHVEHVAGPILIQRNRESQQHHRALHMFVLIRRNIAQGTVIWLWPALAQVARNG